MLSSRMHPQNEYFSSPDKQKQWSLVGLTSTKFRFHAYYNVTEHVKAMKIQAGVQVQDQRTHKTSLALEDPSLDAYLQIAPDANKPNPSPVEDADLIAPHPNTFCNPSLVNWNWDEVILIPSDDDEANVNEPIALPQNWGIFHGIVIHGNVDTERPKDHYEQRIRHIDGSPVISCVEKGRVIQCLEVAIQRRLAELVSQFLLLLYWQSKRIPCVENFESKTTNLYGNTKMTTLVGNNSVSGVSLRNKNSLDPTSLIVAQPGQQVPPEGLAAHAAWTVREFHTCKQEEGQSVSSYVLKMKGYIDNLERLGQPVGQNLAQEGFRKTRKINRTKLLRGGHGKGKGKMGYAPNNAPFAPKPKTLPPPKKDNPAKDTICHQCGEVRHWRRNCPVYLVELMVGDGHRVAVEAIGTYHLELPSGLVIVLNNCHYAPSITRGVISVSRLFDDGFINRFDDNNVISVSKDNLVYFMAVPRDGIFEIDMSCSNTNDSSMYAITNKRAKINLDSSLLWHCRLGHISKKRIEKLQHDGLLNSIDIESLGKCVSCLSGKMARKPYSHQVERAKDLLGLIHTDVCGPFRIVSRQGASYFVTFTDDFSRYGYVYLLKHKHEVFETFKVFQKEVENQLGKTIKSLRSDRGGEYMSQEFLDHLKEHGIIAHRTPPYTPQNNGVSERRNRTLLDMVRSMMSQTTLPKSFWDYALETAARILNMVW
ncbi:retrotransposon protein, putative, ty1-copia subclass [Tanacetum coccineum]|uniref:Retrotransposon protein, putative, ty1-copia subclass n=1 Tax=Tanacetum coccineum TaxID=301880 RepID=A0ABQ4YW40_9ASTR